MSQDEFEKDLDEKLIELKECQDSHDFKGCEPCDEFFSCILRSYYVKAVYKSMSEDSTGGFNF